MNDGIYTVEISNAGGTVTSNPFRITVRPPLHPTITRQPRALEVSLGLRAGILRGASGQRGWGRGIAVVEGRLPVDGARGSTMVVPEVRLTDAGNYTVGITARAAQW